VRPPSTGTKLAPGHRTFVATIVGCAVMFGAGAAAGLYGSRLPVFSAAPEAVQQAFMAWCTDGPGINEAAGQRYLSLFTDHYPLWTLAQDWSFQQLR